MLMSDEVKNWNDLADINDVSEFSDDDESCLNEIQAVVEKYGMQKRFGVSLLHKHFDIHDDKMLVERYNPATRSLTLRPEKIEDLKDQDLITTMYRFDGGVRYKCSSCNKDHHKD